MKIERLSSLLASLYNNNSSATSAKRSAEKFANQSDDAVRVSNSLPQSSTEQNRAGKVTELKERIGSGKYEVDSEKVATALLRDIF